MNRLIRHRIEQLLLVAVVVVSAVTRPSWGFDRVVVQELNARIRAAADQRDWKTAHEDLIELGRQLPAVTPAYMLRMASTEAALGNSPRALQWISRYAATGLKYDLADNEELKPLTDSLEYAQIAALIRKRTGEISKAQSVCSLPIADLMPEDITFDRQSSSFLLSSVQHHRLYQVKLPKDGRDTCTIKELAIEPSAQQWPLLAVALDSKRNLIWVTTAAFGGFSGVSEADAGKTALLALERGSGRVVRRYDLVSSKPAAFGDMCIGTDGTVYVSDGFGGGVYRLRGDPETAALEQIADMLGSPQTPAPAADGKRLFVADYSVGIAVIDLRAPTLGKSQYLPHPESIAVTGLDGLYRFKDSLIGIQNGTTPERIIRYRLDRAQTRIVSAQVIEQSTGRLGEPTHAVLVGGRFYVSANVGWDKVDDEGQLKKGEQFTPAILLSFPAGD